MPIAWVFPGQGSQSTGMALGLAEVGADKFSVLPPRVFSAGLSGR
jgi:malonyl CoA-acyl carrier protein transacylase